MGRQSAKKAAPTPRSEEVMAPGNEGRLSHQVQAQAELGVVMFRAGNRRRQEKANGQDEG